MNLWKTVLSCAECGHLLNTMEHIPEEKKEHVGITFASIDGKCPRCRATTYSYLSMREEPEGDKEWVNCTF